MKFAIVLLLCLVLSETYDFGEREFQTWPDLVGKDIELAKQYFREHHPRLQVVCLSEDAPVTDDLRLDRVRIFYNSDLLVSHIPHNG